MVKRRPAATQANGGPCARLRAMGQDPPNELEGLVNQLANVTRHPARLQQLVGATHTGSHVDLRRKLHDALEALRQMDVKVALPSGRALSVKVTEFNICRGVVAKALEAFQLPDLQDRQLCGDEGWLVYGEEKLDNWRSIEQEMARVENARFVDRDRLRVLTLIRNPAADGAPEEEGAGVSSDESFGFH